MIEPEDISIRYGLPGHEDEYVITIKDYGLEKYIPRSVSQHLAHEVPECFVMNRGSRIEVMTKEPTLELSLDIRMAIVEIFRRRPWL